MCLYQPKAQDLRVVVKYNISPIKCLSIKSRVPSSSSKCFLNSSNTRSLSLEPNSILLSILILELDSNCM